MKYALVTGGSRGIGRNICFKLAQMGYNVLINYVSNEEEALKTLEEVRNLGSDGEILKFNVTDREACKSAISQWEENHPDEYIEVLVNNAGIRRDNLLVRMSEQDWDSVIGIHLGGFYNVTRLVIGNMLSRRHGRIINMASLSGLKGVPGQANYAAAKGGLIAATRSLANEVGRKGITVNAVAPGFIRTDMTEDLNEAELKKNIPLNRFGEAEEVADLVAFLASDKASYITGECISINGGLFM
ncbi:MAG: 3-oxoacyl-[Bacteroidales bacterium]|nr:3-oxoacyl-[acyl-carrier-protein] reductase [Bacteroidales bacterium]